MTPINIHHLLDGSIIVCGPEDDREAWVRYDPQGTPADVVWRNVHDPSRRESSDTLQLRDDIEVIFEVTGITD